MTRVGSSVSAARAVFFDVDFTLIHPGPAFEGAGYREFCARHGIAVDPSRFARAVEAAAVLLDASACAYDPEIYVAYTRAIIEGMGGAGAGVDGAAREIYEAWSACEHFSLYEDVPEVVRALHARGMTMGLISNTQRCLASFQRHFALEGLFAVTLSSANHGFMKPHRSIFDAALREARVRAEDAVMVGDSVSHDIEGARSLGMRAILVCRSGIARPCPPGVPVVTTLREVLALV